MEDITIFHNTRCSKSRCALSILKEEGIKPEVRYYLEDAPSVTEVKELLQKLNIPAVQLVRKTEKIFKENFKEKDFLEEEWVKILSENPRLIERPIVIKGDKAVIGRPAERVKEFLKNN